MQDKEHTAMELDKLNRCKAFLKANGVFDKDSFVDLNKDFLKKHESISLSHFEENAKWRKENKVWLEWSRNIALSLVEYMESNGLNRNGLAERLGVSPQYDSIRKSKLLL